MNSLGINFPFMVGPMVGLSHVAFRELIRAYTPQGVRALRFTEMLSSRRIPSENLDDALALRVAPGEGDFVPQILGNEEKFIGPSIEKLSRQNPWGIDINMGCPETHTLKHNWGVRLMGDKTYAANVVSITKRHAKVPVSVKMRAGMGDGIDLDYLVDFTDALEKAGASWLTIHCRSKEQKHAGGADWSVLRALRRARSVPLVANGDIQNWSEALQVISEFDADGAMLGRAATARPWLLWQISSQLGDPSAPPGRENESPPWDAESEGREYYRACLKFIDLLEEYFGETAFSLKKLFFFLSHGSRWYQFGHCYWKHLSKAKNLREARELVLSYAANNPHPSVHRVNLF